jgi:hypothetical protein
MGLDEEEEEPNPPTSICLDCAEEFSRATEVKFDIDSMVGFANSLAFAKEGILLNFTPRFHENFQTNVYLTLQVTETLPSGRACIKHVSLSKVPHIRLGRVVGDEAVGIFVFFPGQWTAEKPTNFPGKLSGRVHGVLERWTNSILNPSLACVLDSDDGQHLPPSFLIVQ